jgi:hypothetical protein
MHSYTKFLLLFILLTCEATSQDSITVAAGPEYKRSIIHSFFWGKNRREEWTTPVRVPVVILDTLYGGLTPYKRGGGNESRSLRLISAAGKEYTMRSVNKSRKAVTPKLLRHSYFAMIIQDGVSMSYPYGSLAAYEMMEAANIYHPKPWLVYIPQQSALDTFNRVFANDLYTLEERPDGDWSDGASHLGNFKKFYSSEEVITKMHESHLYNADQFAFIKARLFDIMIGDWDRNGGNWVWGANEKNFSPIAKDRDQAFYTTNSFLMNVMTRLTGNGYMQNFSAHVQNVARLTKQDRRVDKIFTNQLSYADWIKAAKELQQLLTDSVIEKSLMNIPFEIHKISGKEILAKLKLRRNELQQYATLFYKTLAKKVDITASKENDRIKVDQLRDGSVSVEIYSIGDSEVPYYKRIFIPKETKAIIINGFGGEDMFEIDGAIKGIKVTTKNIVEPIPPLRHSS